MTLYALSTLLLVGVGFYFFARRYPNTNPNENKIQKDLKEMRNTLESLSGGQLLQLQDKDYELLSTHRKNEKVKKGLTTNFTGVYTSIFDEEIFAYYYRKYPTKGKDAVLTARTSNHEYHYWIRDTGTQVVLDDQVVGTYREGLLMEGTKGNIIARLDHSQTDRVPVYIRNEQVGALALRSKLASTNISQRAFEYVKDNQPEPTYSLMMAIVIYELLDRLVGEYLSDR